MTHGPTTTPRRRGRRGDERGAAIVEFALVVPLLLGMLFGIAEFGVAFNDLNSARSGTREGARAGVVAEFGGSSACTLVGVAPGTPAAELICLTKARIGLDESDTRVMVAFDGENAQGGTLYICSQHAVESITGLFSAVLDHRTLRTEVAMRIEEADPDLVATAETPLPGEGLDVVRVIRLLRHGRAVPGDEQRGAVLVVFAVVLSAMLAFCALVLDVANAHQVRRQAQNAADAAALAGAQELPSPPDVVAAVKEYVARNTGLPASSWVGCSDPDHLEATPDSGNGNTCISISPAFQRVRVRLPVDDVHTYFAGVVGVESIGVRAAATAEAVLLQDDRIIPAAVTSAAGTGNLCIESSGSNTPCHHLNPPTSGNFGSLRSPRLRLFDPGPTAYSDWLRINYAMGIDHALSIYDGVARVCDGDQGVPCTSTNLTSDRTANHLNTETGNEVPPFTDGLVRGFTVDTDDQGEVRFCGRLTRPDLTSDNVAEPAPGGCATPGGPTISVIGTTINGRHAWYWLTPAARSVLYPEISSNATGAISMANVGPGDARLNCLLGGIGAVPASVGYRYDYAHAAQISVPNCAAVGLDVAALPRCGTSPRICIFDHDIVSDPRFGMIPVLDSWSSGQSQPRQLVRFWAIYSYRLYTNNGGTAIQGLDAWVFEPALIETESGVADLMFGFQTDPVIRLVE